MFNDETSSLYYVDNNQEKMLYKHRSFEALLKYYNRNTKYKRKDMKKE